MSSMLCGCQQRLRDSPRQPIGIHTHILVEIAGSKDIAHAHKAGGIGGQRALKIDGRAQLVVCGSARQVVDSAQALAAPVV